MIVVLRTDSPLPFANEVTLSNLNVLLDGLKTKGMHRSLRERDGRAENRSGKTGSHMLRRALREVELPQAALDALAPPAKPETSSAANPDCKGRPVAGLAAVLQPLLATGTSLQKQLMFAACTHFFPDAKSLAKKSEDDSVGKVCDRILFTPLRPQSSLSAEADTLNQARNSFKADLLCTASAVLQAGIGAWQAHLHTLFKHIRSGLLEGLALIKCRVYDETPLKLRVESSSSKQVQLGAKAESCVAKIMQTRFKIGVVVREKASGRVCCYKGIAPTILQGLERTRGEDICLSQSRIISSVPALDSGYDLFKLNLDVTTADRYGANAKAEAGLQALRPWDVPLHIDYHIRKVATSVTWGLKVADQHMSGLVASSLVLRQSGSLAAFREHLLAEMQSNLMVIHGPPPTGRAKEFREQVYTAFLSTNLARDADIRKVQERRAEQKAVLSRFLCGDLEDETCVQFFTGAVHATEDQITRVLKTFVIPALIPGSMPTYARHRWMGGEQAVDFVGLLESHHRLFSRTILRMYQIARSLPLQSGGVAPVGWGALEAEALPGQQVDPAVDAMLEEGSAINDFPASKDASDWAEFNKSMQKKVQAWAKHVDMAVLALMRCVMTASANLMRMFLKRSSEDWDKEQDSLWALWCLGLGFCWPATCNPTQSILKSRAQIVEGLCLAASRVLFAGCSHSHLLGARCPNLKHEVLGFYVI